MDAIVPKRARVCGLGRWTVSRHGEQCLETVHRPRSVAIVRRFERTAGWGIFVGIVQQFARCPFREGEGDSRHCFFVPRAAFTLPGLRLDWVQRICGR
jgi:hypothetical protein